MAYDTLKIYGGSDINYVTCSTLTPSEEDISNLIESGLQSPEWTNNTIMLANFTEDSNGSSYGVQDNIKEYRIQRYEVDYDKLYSIATVDGSNSYFEDYGVRNGKSYQYRIVPVYMNGDDEMFGAPIETDIVTTDWCGWSVIGTKPTKKRGVYTVDYDNVWNFMLNVEPSDIKYVQKSEFLTGFGKYPKQVQGHEDYIQSSLSCLLGNINCIDYEGDTIDMIKKWKAFCNNGQLKLVRDPKGLVIPCAITDVSHNNNYALLEQITTISFSFTQLADERDIIVYGLGA